MKVRFVTPWYPDYAAIHSGIFVAKQVEGLRHIGYAVTVEVPQIFPAPAGPIPKTVTDSMRALAAKSTGAMFASTNGVTYVPTPVPSRGGPMGRAEAMAASLGILHEIQDDEAELVHAHVGMPTGWAVSHTIGDKPLVVTEHWSGLASVLHEPIAAEAYAEVLHRADAFICVSKHLRNQIVEALGDWAAERIDIIPNIVDLTDIPFRDRSDLAFRSWIYVGGLMPHKGVQSLLRSFDEFVKRHDSEARLTLVGDGPLRRWIEMFTVSRGLADSVTLTGLVEHSELGRHLDQADVMVHLSPAETFGIATLEGIGAGLPVISSRNEGAVSAWGDIEASSGCLLSLEATPGEIADAVADLRDSPERLDLILGRKTVEERFSSSVIAARLAETYMRALG